MLLLCSTSPLMILERSPNWPKVYANNLSLHVSSKGITKVIPLLDTWETWPVRQKERHGGSFWQDRVMLIQFASFLGMLIRLQKSCIVRIYTIQCELLPVGCPVYATGVVYWGQYPPKGWAIGWVSGCVIFVECDIARACSSVMCQALKNQMNNIWNKRDTYLENLHI